MAPLTELAHDIVRSIVKPGETAIDATVGNGHDTLFLAQLVGPTGHVIGCDIQTYAINVTRTKLRQAVNEHVDLRIGDHAQLLKMLQQLLSKRVAAVMFNLGYLPTSDMVVVTKPETTIPAIRSAVELLRPGGVLSVMAYVGHPGGREEAQAVEELFSALIEGNMLSKKHWPESPMDSDSPKLYVGIRVEETVD